MLSVGNKHQYLLAAILTLVMMLASVSGVVRSASAQSAPIDLTMTTSNGTVPGTAITYTISNNGGSPRAIFPPGSSDHNVWTWTNSFAEFVSGEAQTLTVTFSAPVPISAFVFGVNSTVTGSTGQLTLIGGTAGVADFNLTDSILATPGAVYDPSTGQISNTVVNGSIMVGSNSPKTVTSFTYANDSDFGDGYTVFFGLVQPLGPTNKDQCKNEGWQSLVRNDGTPFKNQGDCIQYVNTGK
jgi:hypothetical protein